MERTNGGLDQSTLPTTYFISTVKIAGVIVWSVQVLLAERFLKSKEEGVRLMAVMARMGGA
jgi:hypothetical protein